MTLPPLPGPEADAPALPPEPAPARRGRFFGRGTQAPGEPQKGPRWYVGESWRTVREHPREAMLPILVIQAPVAVATAILTVVLYLTAFKDEPILLANELIEDGFSGPLFLLLITVGIQFLFGQVARGATIVSVAALRAGKPIPLREALDPAFMHMGGLLLIGVVFLAVIGLLAFTIVGIALIPYFVARLGVAVEAYMLEGTRPFAAFGRSWQLMQGHMLRFLGALILAILIAILPIVAVSFLSEAAVGSRTTEVVVGGIVGAVQAVLLVPFVAFLTVLTTVFYLQIRTGANDRATA